MKGTLWFCLGASLWMGNWAEGAELRIAATIRSQAAKPRLAVVQAVPVVSAASPEEELQPVTATFEVPGETRLAGIADFLRIPRLHLEGWTLRGDGSGRQEEKERHGKED